MGGLVYYNVGNGCLYTIADDVLYKMDMNKSTKKELATGLNEDQYVASEDGHLVAYEKERSFEVQVCDSYESGD